MKKKLTCKHYVKFKIFFLQDDPKSNVAKPAATKPAATKPAATKPAATKPAATKQAATKPPIPKQVGTNQEATKRVSKVPQKRQNSSLGQQTPAMKRKTVPVNKKNKKKKHYLRR